MACGLLQMKKAAAKTSAAAWNYLIFLTKRDLQPVARKLVPMLY